MLLTIGDCCLESMLWTEISGNLDIPGHAFRCAFARAFAQKAKFRSRIAPHCWLNGTIVWVLFWN